MNVIALAYAGGYTLKEVIEAIKGEVAAATAKAVAVAEAELRAVEARDHTAAEWNAAGMFLICSLAPVLPQGIRGRVARRVGAGNLTVFNAMFDMAVDKGAAQ